MPRKPPAKPPVPVTNFAQQAAAADDAMKSAFDNLRTSLLAAGAVEVARNTFVFPRGVPEGFTFPEGWYPQSIEAAAPIYQPPEGDAVTFSYEFG